MEAADVKCRFRRIQVVLGVISALAILLTYYLAVDQAEDDRRTAWQIHWMGQIVPEEKQAFAEFNAAHPHLQIHPYAAGLRPAALVLSGYVIVAIGVWALGNLSVHRSRHT